LSIGRIYLSGRQFNNSGGMPAYRTYPVRAKIENSLDNPIVSIYKKHIYGEAHKESVDRIARLQDYCLPGQQEFPAYQTLYSGEKCICDKYIFGQNNASGMINQAH
jgi:hypothetical protein